MRPVRKTKSTIPNIPRPMSGQSKQSELKDNYKKKRIQRNENVNNSSNSKEMNLLNKLNGAFKTLDLNNNSSYDQNISKLNSSKDFSQYGDNLNDTFENSMYSSSYSSKQFKNSTNTPLDGKDVLAKAKSLLEKQKSDIPALKQKQKLQQLKKSRMQKDSAFLTGVNIYKEESPPKYQEQKDKQSEQEEDLDFNEEEYIKDLIMDEKQSKEDYSDMWRLINDTKREMCDYAEELYHLNKFTSDTNNQLNEGGMGVRPDRFWQLDNGLEQQMPNGDKKYIFKDKHTLPSISNSKQQLQKLHKQPSNSNLNTTKPKSKAIISAPTRKKSVDRQILSSRKKTSTLIDNRDNII